MCHFHIIGTIICVRLSHAQWCFGEMECNNNNRHKEPPPCYTPEINPISASDKLTLCSPSPRTRKSKVALFDWKLTLRESNKVACGKRTSERDSNYQISDMKYLKSLKYLAGRNGVQTGDKGAPQKAQPLGTGWCSAAFSHLQHTTSEEMILRVCFFFRRSEADVRSDGECVITAKRHKSSSLHWQLYYVRDDT